MPSSAASEHGGTTQAPSLQDGEISPKSQHITEKLGPGETAEETVHSTKVKGEGEQQDYDYLAEKEAQGAAKYHKLGWIKLVVVLIVEAIALGSLSIPGAFATLGMVAGVLLTVGIGLICVYTSYVVGQVKLKFPSVKHYSDIGPLLAGPNRPRLGLIYKEIISVMFVLQLSLLVASHCLTGTIAFGTITEYPICSLVFGVVSAILLYCLAIPPSFSEMAILGYIDFVSIIAAIFITLIATGVRANQQPGGRAAVDWSALPQPGTTFAEAMVAVTNIAFAYSFAVCQFSFMEEMHTPTDYVKSIWSLGLIEIAIYTITGAVGYALIGQDVQSPALLSAGATVAKVAFGVALPVIFISGSINTVVVGRFIMDRAFADKPLIRYVNTPKGWSVWLGLIGAVTLFAWIVAEAIPFFSSLLGVISSLFISGFSFYFPGILWLCVIRQGGFFSSTKNTILTLSNVACILIGLIILVGGFYGSVVEIIDSYKTGSVGGSFSCAPLS